MTSEPKKPDPALHDDAVNAAWRELPREEPPAPLDAAIRASAHRAVAARPKRVREATRPGRWWWPLAAAATIGAITIGILQIGEPDRRDGSRGEPAVVSDVPPQLPQKMATPEPAEPPKAAVAAAPAPQAAVPTKPTAPAPSRESRRGTPLQKEEGARVDASVPPPEPPPSGSTLAQRDVASPPSAAANAGGRLASGAADAAAAQAKGANPFPGAATMAPPAPAASPPAMAPSRPEAAGQARRLQDSAPAEARAPLPVPDWIALIRRLRADGRVDEAARELTAFRAAHADHAQLLPPDLRDWRPETPTGATAP